LSIIQTLLLSLPISSRIATSPIEHIFTLRTIGLTGGIATGKTTVSNYLSHRVQVLDADVLAREAVLPGSDRLQTLVRRYGPELLCRDGILNREKLAQIIFQDANEKRWVESIIHPYVRRHLVLRQSQETASTLVMVIPLLFEAQMTDLVSEIWVVSCTPEQQLARLIRRSGLTQKEAQARIDSQMPLAQKCAQADVVLENQGSLEALYCQVDQALGIAPQDTTA
jgi:dephospho-CoA kinase